MLRSKVIILFLVKFLVLQGKYVNVFWNIAPCRLAEIYRHFNFLLGYMVYHPRRLLSFSY